MDRAHLSSALRRLLAVMCVTAIVAACSPTSATPEAPTFEGPPVVSIVSPFANDTYQEGVGINILINVSNAGPDVARIAIEVDNLIIGEAIMPNPEGAASFSVRNGWPAQGVGTHTISVIASRTDGTASTPATVSVNVIANPNSQAQPTTDTQAQAQPTQQILATPDSQAQVQPTQQDAPTQQQVVQPTQQVAPTDPPAPTNTSAPTATFTPSRPQVRVASGANVRSGPGVVFEPPIGSLAAGATANILAVSTSGTWYKIQYYNGEAWIAAQVVEVIGDISALPREAGPATPIPVTPTPVVPTAAPASADLSVVNWTTSPFPLTCAQAAANAITIANSGTGNSGATRVVVEDLFNGAVTASATADVGPLAPGQNVVINLNITVTTNHSQGHVLRVRVDPDNTVPETNEGNNSREVGPYPLAQGGC